MEIVIKTIFRGRAKGDLRAGEKLLHRHCQHMGGIVADQFQGLWVLTPDQFQLRIFFNGAVQVPFHPIYAGQHGGLG